MKFLLIITSAPYGNANTFNSIELANSILSLEHELTIFFYADGVYNALRTIDPASDEFNPLKSFCNLSSKVNFYLCQSAAKRRGIVSSVMVPFVKESSLAELSDLVATNDRVVSL